MIINQVPVFDGVVVNGKLEQAMEQQSAASGGSTVKPEDELIQITGQMFRVHGTLVCAQQPAFGQRSDPVNAGSQRSWIFAPGGGGSLATRFMDVSQLLDVEVPAPAVGDHCGAKGDVVGNGRVQGGGGSILEDGRAAPAESIGLDDTDGDADPHLLAAGPPVNPGSWTPMKVSSTSTAPVRGTRPGWDSTDRNRCNIDQALWWEPICIVFWSANAHSPFFVVANSQDAVNQTVNGILV